MDGDAIATSLGLFTKVKDVKFIGTVYILSEVLPHLSTMSKAFQELFIPLIYSCFLVAMFPPIT